MDIDYCFWCGKEITTISDGVVDADGQLLCSGVLNWSRPHETTDQAMARLLLPE